MPRQYLLVAEVDKIQSFVFRSARRREVVGASFLLSEFSEQIGSQIQPRPASILTNAGGSFRFLFDTEQAAQEAGRYLERRFTQEVGGSITVAAPVEYDPATPSSGIAQGNVVLHEAKLSGREAHPVWQFPIQALCASCGEELAQTYAQPYRDEPGRYICETCLKKARVKWFGLFEALLGELTELRGTPVRLADNAAEADIYAEGWDPNNYVAYLLADGNYMGELFSFCTTQEALARLSAAVTQVSTQALAEATCSLIDQHSMWKEQMPCLPLIMGGDDLFVLLPAPWAYHVASLFCDAYETRMNGVLNEMYDEGMLIDPEHPKQPPRATIGVALVICKATYPYKLAHQYGERLLDEVKDTIKALPRSEQRSMFAVELIRGPQSVKAHITGSSNVYFLEDAQAFLEWRFVLKDIASRTLEHLRINLGANLSPGIFLSRTQQLSKRNYTLLSRALSEMGTTAFLELLNHWDFAFDLGRVRAEYAKVGD